MKVIRFDKGGEYLSKAWQSYCRDACVKRELTARCNHQKNGAAERMNSSLLRMAPTLLA